MKDDLISRQAAIDEDEVVKFYTNMGEEVMELSVGVHEGGKTAMTNAEFLTANKTDFFRLSCKKRTDEKGVFDILLDGRKFARIYASDNTSEMDALLAWLDMKHKEPILDDAEKRYLSAVIKPFRSRVWYIRKSFVVDKANCYIFIRFNDGSGDMNFPVFSKSDMYKGMKLCKSYSLEELGL